MFNHKHYVPILKAKAGEFWALRNLKKATIPLITPVFELVPYDTKKTFEDDLASRVVTLAESWKGPLFFDIYYAAPKNELPHPSTIATTFRRLRKEGAKAIPVTRLGYSPKFQEAVGNIVQNDKAGLMIRLTVTDLAVRDKMSTALSNLCQILGVVESDVDLLIDYGFKHPDEYEDLILLQKHHLAKIPNVTKWRTLSLAFSSFPQSLNDLPSGKWVSLDRTEWKCWECFVPHNAAIRKPSYGDYGIRHPALPGFGAPKPNLRYTLEEIYLCRKDEAKHVAMRDICRSLLNMKEYKGPNFSAGDKAISETAASQGSGGTGGGQQWTQWCSNHHFEFVATQIQSLPVS